MRISPCASDLPPSLELILEVDTAQDNARRSAFELPSQEFASGTLFNPIAESDELGLTLVRLGPRRAFQMIHCGCRDRARYLPLAINHRKQHDHPVKFVADKATACERHSTNSPSAATLPEAVSDAGSFHPSRASRAKSSNMAVTKSRCRASVGASPAAYRSVSTLAIPRT